ncbi:MAG TPA: hypothetical protein VFD73_25820, partial [Gemmatimonadales bacterium]|nr:hypothetical protein [Gemmatimonadales bacterium]
PSATASSPWQKATAALNAEGLGHGCSHMFVLAATRGFGARQHVSPVAVTAASLASQRRVAAN